MFNWIKGLRYIVANYRADTAKLDRDITGLERYIKLVEYDAKIALQRAKDAERIIKERTDLSADLHYTGQDTVIVIGRYRNNDYIQTFNLGKDDFMHTIDQLKVMTRHATVRTVDTPPMMRAAFNIKQDLAHEYTGIQ